MPKLAKLIRLAVFTVLVGAMATLAVLLLTTERGQSILDNPHRAGRDAQQWVAAHRMIAPVAFMACYALLVVLMFPVWWIQIIAGYVFGLFFGVLWCQVPATLGSAIGLLLSRFVAADWYHEKVESRLEKLRALDEKMGHNGFLVVMGVRLMHFVPIGVSNYLFGLTRITLMDVVVGTFIGGIPSVAVYVGIGGGYHVWSNWRFLGVLLVINLTLLVPIILRYTRPQWFRKIGIE